MKMSHFTRFLAVPAAVVAIASGGTASADQSVPARKLPTDALAYPKLHDVKMPAVVRAKLPNGMRLLLVEDHDLPQISFRALVRGGRIAAGRPGLAGLFAETQRTGGTSTMTGDAVDQLLDRLGAEIETGVQGPEAYGVVEGKTLKENFGKVLPVFAGILTSPALAEDKLELAKTHMRSAIARRNDNVMGIAAREFQKLVYGPKSLYAQQVEYADVDGLKRDDLVAFHRTFYRPDATILAVWGDFRAQELKAQLTTAFRAWKSSGPAPKVASPPVADQGPSLNYVEKKDVEQTYILAGRLGVRMDDPDYPALQVMNEILGGGFASRIFVKVRSEKGLAYMAGSQMSETFDHPGGFYFYTSTKPSTTAEALTALLGEIKGIGEAPVTDAELVRAKEGFLNGYVFNYDSTAKIVNRLATYEFYGYPADFHVKLRDAIEKVTKEDVLRVSRKHLKPSELTILAIGRQELFDKPLSTFDKVATLDITIPEPKAKEAAAEATPEALAGGKALMAKAAAAMGEKALKELKDVTSEGTATINTPGGAMELKVKSTFILPGRLHSEMTTPMGVMAQVVDGEKAWMKMGGNARDLPESAAGEMRLGLYTEAGCALLVREVMDGRLAARSAGRTPFEGKDADDVLVQLGGKAVHVYISPDTGEILAVKRMARTQEGPAEMVESFGARQVVSGLRVPFESTQKVKGEVKASSKLSAVKINAGFAEEIFQKPPAPPAK